ncbi:hypothetical protein [Pseudonocardia parietis]|uniref:Integral membrane protein n=1 Tax=Pseudonocardia parietis TaxID=570936 RepID=A0ABS4VP06_9PSEU|nr:hypothetical protein [Pseudonocardia parietis]MBP2365657.1 hypothetical protein [Pseudonocardia parietis]
MSNDPGQQGTPQYYRPGPSSGTYPQYPQNPYPHGWTPGTPPAPYPQQVPGGSDPQQAGPQPGPQWNTTGGGGWGNPPAGLGQTPAAKAPRPRQLVTALIMLLAAALPFVLMGVAAMVTPVDESMLEQAGIPRAEYEAMMTQAGMTFDQLAQMVRVMGAVFLVLALIYAALAVVAFLGAGGARLALAVLTGVYGLPLLLMMAPTLPLFGVLVVAVAAAGVVLLYSRPAKEWYAARKVGAAQRSG